MLYRSVVDLEQVSRTQIRKWMKRRDFTEAQGAEEGGYSECKEREGEQIIKKAVVYVSWKVQNHQLMEGQHWVGEGTAHHTPSLCWSVQMAPCCHVRAPRT